MNYWINQFAVAPDQPGGTRHIEMSAELIRQGVPVTLVASDLNLNRRRYLRRNGAADRRWLRETIGDVPFVWLPAGSYESNDWRRALSMVIFAMHVLLFLMRAPRSRNTVFIGSTPHLLAAAATWAAARSRRVPFVLEVRDLWPESMVGVSGGGGGPLVPVLRLLSDRLYRSADSIIVLAEPNIDRLVQRGADRSRIAYIPNGVDVTSFEDADLEACQVNIDKSTAAFAYTGAHGPANGLDLVLDAAKSLQDRDETGVRVVLVGDGAVKQQLVARARSLGLTNVDFVDPIPKSEIPGLLSPCHGALMVLANVEVFHYGVSPNKLFDYLTAQVPVVANVPGEISRIVVESGGGEVVPPDDPGALADAIVKVAGAPLCRTGSREWIREHHDRRALVSRLRESMDTARSRRRPSKVAA